jgi:DNA mismatch repair protein MutL
VGASPRVAEESSQRYLAVPAGGEAQPTAAPMVEPAGPSVLGQHRNTYIVASDGEELLLVDQHTAHERVRFEAILDRLSRRAVESQRLLLPIVVEPEPRLRPQLLARATALAELGFEIEPFGGGSFRVAAVPALLGTGDPAPALLALLRDLAERDSTEWIVAGDRERMAATLACHSAHKAGDPLSREQMGGIVHGLLRTAHPTQCPHGRPTFVRIPREDVTRWFGRTGWRRQ